MHDESHFWDRRTYAETWVKKKDDNKLKWISITLQYNYDIWSKMNRNDDNTENKFHSVSVTTGGVVELIHLSNTELIWVDHIRHTKTTRIHLKLQCGQRTFALEIAITYTVFHDEHINLYRYNHKMPCRHSRNTWPLTLGLRLSDICTM